MIRLGVESFYDMIDLNFQTYFWGSRYAWNENLIHVWNGYMNVKINDQN